MIVIGNERLLDDKSAIVLNSSQSKTPCGNDAWIMATSRAVENLISSGYALVTSLGLNTWELTAHLAAEFAGRQIIVLPEVDNGRGQKIFEEIIEQFGLDGNRTAVVFPAEAKKSNKPKANWEIRDRAAIDISDLLVPVSIRPGGKLEMLIGKASATKMIESSYRVDHRKTDVSPPRYLKDEIGFEPADWDFLTHWTRTCHGPWPGQSNRSFYRNLVKSNSEYPNNAFSTLINLASENIIRASSKKMRKGEYAVGFTESDPAKTIGNLRWLSKRTNWNFEPYGIAIRKQVAIELGLRPVIYGDSDDYLGLKADDEPYFQSKGRKNVDWSEEKEWRHIGDIDLSKIPGEDIRFLTWRKYEADWILNMTGIETLALTGT